MSFYQTFFESGNALLWVCLGMMIYSFYLFVRNE
jgi:hypothetical protein